MLVVLLILGIVAGVSTPAIGRFLDNLAFRKQTADILAAVRYARLMAITKSKTVTLTIDERDRTAVKFSGGVEEVREIALEEDSSFAFDPDEITFYPDGLSTPAEIRSARKERSTEFSLAPLTGLPVRK
jgi:Tfp pilus assembly protein FimT